MTRVFNFSAGPAALPEPVLERARTEMLDYAGSGMSVMEMSHRSAEFIGIAERAEADLRSLLAIPDDYAVLFLQGGASAQFSAVPLNLAGPGDVGAYVNTGSWSKKAIAEGKRLCQARVIASSEEGGFTSVPPQAQWDRFDDAAYVHVCPNETIGGVAYPFVPDTGEVPLVADLSSTILSEPIDVARYGVIYAGAQKNIGPAGITVVIVRRDLLGRAREGTPVMLDWAVQAEADSMYNTPPTFAWYLSGLVFEWLRDLGGLEAMAAINRQKAGTLYGAIAASNFYASPVAEECRSRMNVPFTLADPELDARFLQEAEAAGLMNLKGHRSVGGMRASLYNAVPQAAVDALVAFMQDFERRNG
jgi:phosphoserine aminotransferase